jgi:hypothetical protein
MPIPYLHVPCLWSSSALTLMADSSLRGFSSRVVIRLSVVMFVFSDPDALVYSYLRAKYIQRQGHGTSKQAPQGCEMSYRSRVPSGLVLIYPMLHTLSRLSMSRLNSAAKVA